MKNYYPGPAKIFLFLLILSVKNLSAQLTQTFSFTGTMQTFTVPVCVTSVTADLRGAQGGGTSGALGGLGGRTMATFTTVPGEVLEIWVGGAGTYTTTTNVTTTVQGAGGFNGGGAFTNIYTSTQGGTGGGASDIRRGSGFSNRIVVAGGGGGGSTSGGQNRAGGDGGGLLAATGGTWNTWPLSGGGGGSQSSGGVAGVACCETPSPGIFGIGGIGAGDGAAGCGGGGGWYGGGGGLFGGGGGGSSYTGYAGNTNTSTTSGYQSGNGLIILSYNTNGSGVTASASSTIICTGSTVSLTTSGSVLSYTWSNGSNSPSLTVSPTSNTMYVVSATNNSNCISTSSVNILVSTGLPVLTINSSTTQTCLGKTATLTATGANTFTWTNNVTNGVSFSPSVTTTYVVTGQNGCGSGTAAVTISVAPLPVSLVANPTIVCAGKPATLTAVAAATNYTWQPNNSVGTSSLSVVAPTVNTVYTVTATDGTCSGIATVSLLANPVPTVNISSSSTLICAGDVLSLNASGGISYTWTPGNLTGSSIVVTPTTSTQYSVAVANSFGCLTGASTVVITNPSPTVSAYANNYLICVGDPVTLWASGANSYAWSSGAITATTVENPPSSIVYTVTGTTNICSSTQTVEVDVFNPTVSVSGPTAVCKGGSATLTASGANTYSWSNGYTFPNLTVSPTVTTIFTVSALTSSGSINCPSSNTIQLTVNPNPTVTALSTRTAICRNETVTITASGASTYSWSNAASGPSIAVSSSLATTLSYSVTGTNSNSCSATAGVQIKVNACTGLSEYSNNDDLIMVYPNPNNGEFIVRAGAETEISIVSELGQIVKTMKLNAANNNQVNISGLAAGMYYLIGEKEGKEFRQKLVVNK